MIGPEEARRYLQPGDERFVRGVDPFTAGLTLMALAEIRALVEQMFPWAAGQPASTRKDHRA